MSKTCTKILSILNGNNSDDSAVMVASNFVFLLWKQFISIERRNSIFNALLNNLMRYRKIEKVLPLFENALVIKFKLLPLDLNEIRELIKLWTSTGNIIT